MKRRIGGTRWRTGPVLPSLGGLADQEHCFACNGEQLVPQPLAALVVPGCRVLELGVRFSE
jgi:hypothetical protein